MKKTVFIEGIILLTLSILCLYEGIHLVTSKDAKAVDELLGPGHYIAVLGILLMITAAMHIILNYKILFKSERGGLNNIFSTKVIGMVTVCALYILLINLIGYFGATIFFFILIFRILGIKLWSRNILLSLGITILFYIIFIRLSEMPFSRGILF